MGPQSGVLIEHKDPAKSFAKKVRAWVYIVGGITNGYFCGNTKAVYFNYPEDILKRDPKIVTSYTYNMSMATTPYNTKEVFSKIKLPTALLIASDDEQFIAEKIVPYKDEIPQQTYRYAEIIPQAKHLTILLQAPELIAQQIKRFKKN